MMDVCLKASWQETPQCFTVRYCYAKPPHGLQLYSEKYSHWVACEGTWRQWGNICVSGGLFGSVYWGDILILCALHHCMKYKNLASRLSESTRLLIRCLHPAALFLLIFTPSPLSLFPLLLLASYSSTTTEGHGYAANLITLYMSESLRVLSLFMN